MTRICEKFVEELTSGNRQFSAELREHLAGCPECQQAAESLNLLKANRKPISGREAASIAAVIKAVQSEAATATSAAEATAASSIPPVAAASSTRYLLLSLLGIAMVASFLMNSYLTQQNASQQAPLPLRQIQPALQPAETVKAVEPAVPADSPALPAEFDDLAEPLINSENGSQTAEVARATLSSEETIASPATEIKMVSPDAEEVSP